MLDLNEHFDSLPWLAGWHAQFVQWQKAGRSPHGLLIIGREGMGRRALALDYATLILGQNPARPSAGDPDEDIGHPDFHTVELLWTKDSGKRKQTLGVDQIRALNEQLMLTSHGGSGSVAVVYPAERLTHNAANALLKTLEEPPPDTHIVLISETAAELPATILSRCQKLRLTPPDPAEAATWLQQFAPDKDFSNMLDFVGGAPLAALQLHRDDFASHANQLAADLQKLEQKQANPAAIAGKWGRQEPDLALQWLHWMLARRVRRALEQPAAPGNRALTRAAFRQMSQIRELRRVLKSGISAELNIVGLLMDWYGGLGNTG